MRSAYKFTLTPGIWHADFSERVDRTEFSVEAEDLADGSYRIFVGGVDRGGLVVNLGMGETEFRSPAESGKVLLTFDPRGEVVEVHDGQGAVLTSGDIVIGDDDDNPPVDDDIEFGTTEIRVDLTNTGKKEDTHASAESSLHRFHRSTGARCRSELTEMLM